ncbi:MAG: AbrB family transcriptional regulator [Desulfurococcales archaeon]|nr:AbrB family transcriptional regulator [Desulfurococcales archaeon]
MRITDIVRMDAKGRVTIPALIRETLGINEGMYLVIIGDSDSKEIILTPIISSGQNVYEITVEFQDVPGAFASVSDELARQGADQITTRCSTIRRGDIAECTMVVDLSNAKVSVDELKEILNDLSEVRMVSIRPIRVM